MHAADNDSRAISLLSFALRMKYATLCTFLVRLGE